MPSTNKRTETRFGLQCYLTAVPMDCFFHPLSRLFGAGGLKGGSTGCCKSSWITVDSLSWRASCHRFCPASISVRVWYTCNSGPNTSQRLAALGVVLILCLSTEGRERVGTRFWGIGKAMPYMCTYACYTPIHGIQVCQTERDPLNQ